MQISTGQAADSPLAGRHHLTAALLLTAGLNSSLRVECVLGTRHLSGGECNIVIMSLLTDCMQLC